MIEDIFKGQFRRNPDTATRTPGRVNLIGEHIDYNGGMVLPAALPRKVSVAIAARGDQTIRVYSTHFEQVYTASLTAPAANHWADYAIAAVQIAHGSGLTDTGFDIALDTDLPIGAGLSSSAAMIVGILKAVGHLSDKTVEDVTIAKLARRAENEYIGVPCGIMDQMAVSVATAGQAIALDTLSLDYALINLAEAYDMAIIHSGQHRKLSDGHYKIRREECQAAARALGVDHLCLMDDISAEKIAELPAPLGRRAAHCYTEHQRSKAALSALRRNDMHRFGKLMLQSHMSMRDDFEMSLPQIDALVKDAARFGALGARLTGGGFGGCIVACIEKTLRPEWETKLLSAHPDAFKVL